MTPIQIVVRGFVQEQDLKSLTKEISKSSKDAQALLKKIHKLQEEMQDEVDKAAVKGLKKKMESKKK